MDTLYQAVVVAMLVCTRYYNVYGICITLVNKTIYIYRYNNVFTLARYDDDLVLREITTCM